MMKRLAPLIVTLSLLAAPASSFAHAPKSSARSAAGDAAERALLKGADARINRLRMGTLVVLVHDPKGMRVSTARVSVEQTRHAFLFGANLFQLKPGGGRAQLAYQDAFASLFNYATLPFYWGAFERERGRPDYARLEAMARWCVPRGIKTKGHPLIWHEVYPRWAPQDPEATAELLRARVADLIARYDGLVNVWDVINEANAAARFQNGVGRWAQRDGAPRVVKTALAWARDAGRGREEKFLYNDYELGPWNVALLSQLEKDGSLPDAIGLQTHMHKGLMPLARVWEVCETFARFGRPLHFTEVTVISGPAREFDYQGPPLGDWLTTPAGEAAQADYVEKFYTLLFSHPSVEAITWWDLSDTGAWLGAPAGLLRRNMTPKPAYTRLKDLIRGRWWTRAAGPVSAGGEFRTRAFLGDYRITVTARGITRTYEATVAKNGAAENVVNLRL